MQPCLCPDPGGVNSLRAGPASLHQPGRCSLVLPPPARLTAPLPEAIRFQRLETLTRHLQSGLHRGHCFPEVWAEHLIERSHPPPPLPARPVPLALLIPEHSSLPDTLSLVFTLLIFHRRLLDFRFEKAGFRGCVPICPSAGHRCSRFTGVSGHLHFILESSEFPWL